MARVRWQGVEFNASVIEAKPDGTYLMQAQQETPRCAAGTIISVKPEEIISTDVGGRSFAMAGAAVNPPKDTVVIDAGPPPEGIVATSSQRLPAGTPLGTIVTGKAAPMAIAKTPKLAGLQGKFSNMLDRVEAAAETAGKTMDSVAGNVEGSVGKLVAATGPIADLAKSIEDTANQLTNGGPPLGNSGG